MPSLPRPSFPQRLSSLPTRLKPGHNNNSTSTSNNNSRTSSPVRMSMMGDNKNGNLVLRVSVLKGRNLAPKDKNGLSDPYMVFTLGDAREATPAIPKTLNPEWNVNFDLPISGAHSLLLEAMCWDKDRFGKDYMGEFDIPLEDIFADGLTSQEARWYPLQCRRNGKKSSHVSGDILLQFSIFDPIHSSATPQQILNKLGGIVASSSPTFDEDEEDPHLDRMDSADFSEAEDPAQGDVPDEKKKRRLRLARLKKKATMRAYEFGSGSDIAGVLFLEITKITDLPPEKNMTKTSYDCDPFVVTSLGRKTYRTRVIRHNLNPVFEEKLVFQVLKHEVNYSLSFAVVDRDKLSGNDFIGTVDIPLAEITSKAPEADPETGLYHLRDPPEARTPPASDTSDSRNGRKSRFRLPISRSSSATSLTRLGKPSLKKESSSSSLSNYANEPALPPPPTSNPQQLVPPENGSVPIINVDDQHQDDPDLRSYQLPLDLKHKEKWEGRHYPTLHIRAKYLSYRALRQQFWRAMLRQYDADDSGHIDKVELTTMLDNLGSTLHGSTINSFFQRFAAENVGGSFLTIDQAVICLEDQLHKTGTQEQSFGDRMKGISDGVKGFGEGVKGISEGMKTLMPQMPQMPQSTTSSTATTEHDNPSSSSLATPDEFATPLNNRSQSSLIPALQIEHHGKAGEEGEMLDTNDLADDEQGEEHVIEIRECPICHQPRLQKKSDADIVTHIATCASQDWRQVNNIVMSGFVTSSQAQRKWYSKVINKVSYGGYKLGANSANILVQDRITGQINEERMSVYVRLGIRLMYKGLKSNTMDQKRVKKLLRSLSIKQGRKFDDPASASEIASFINFHQLDMSEVLLPTDAFKSFNEFFYRALKPSARPCSAPDTPEIVTSPADCRSVVFNRLDDAQRIWVKGREFSIARLLGDAYPEDVARYRNGPFGVFRLAPQDYHRFHIPVDGIMGEPRLIEGEYYTVNPMAIRSALDVYGENIRVLVPIDSEKHGRVMVVCVGAMMVGSTVITRKPGEHVRRAEELGYFKFGGSTILLLFEPGSMVWDDDLVENSTSAVETLIRVGMSVGHSPNVPPHTPDMRQEGYRPSMEERQDAKRRIEGSLAPSTDAGPMAANVM